MKVQRTPQDAFYEQAHLVERLATLSDEFEVAMRAADYYTIHRLARENVRMRQRLGVVGGEIGDFSPSDDQDVRIALSTAERAARIQAGDNMYRDWRMSERTGDLYGASWCTQALDNVVSLLPLPTIQPLRGAFEGVPAIIVSAGPSLDKNLHHLQSAAGKAVIIAMNQTVRATQRVGAPADLALTVDSANVLYQLEGEGALQTSIAARVSVHPDVFSVPGRRIFVFSGSVTHENWVCRLLGGDDSKLSPGGSVAHMCFTLAEHLGCDPVILIGQDLALSESQIYSRYAADHDSAATVSEDGKSIQHKTSARKAAHIPHTANIKEPLVEVPGYYGGTVQTTYSLAIFRRTFCRWFTQLQGSLRIINATEGGAAIDGAEQMPFEEAVAQFCTTPVDVEGILARAAEPPDLELRRTRVREAFLVLGEQMETALRISERCVRNMETIGERGWRPEDEEWLRAEDRRFVSALGPLADLFSLMLLPDVRQAAVGVQEMRDFKDSIKQAQALYRRAADTIAKIRPHVDAVLTYL